MATPACRFSGKIRAAMANSAIVGGLISHSPLDAPARLCPLAAWRAIQVQGPETFIFLPEGQRLQLQAECAHFGSSVNCAKAVDNGPDAHQRVCIATSAVFGSLGSSASARARNVSGRCVISTSVSVPFRVLGARGCESSWMNLIANMSKRPHRVRRD